MLTGKNNKSCHKANFNDATGDGANIYNNELIGIASFITLVSN